MQINPSLTQSPFVVMPGMIALSCIKFRLGSHSLPIEVGRWRRKKRNERLCTHCNELGDEKHFLFRCLRINRDGMRLIDDDLENVWKNENILKQLIDAEYITH